MNGITIHINLSNTNKKIKDWSQRLDGTHPEDNIKIFLQDFISEVREAIVIQYIQTYSKSYEMVKRRTYALEKALNYDNVRQTSRYGFMAYATRHSLWPLGVGSPFYSIFQEFGTININARNFILQGDNYIKMFLDKRLRDRLRKWSRS